MNRTFACLASLGLVVGTFACRGAHEDAGTQAQAEGVDVEAPMSLDAMIERAKSRDYWPDQTTGWKSAERDMSSEACTGFENLVLPRGGAAAAIDADTQPDKAADAIDAKTAADSGVKVADLKDEQKALRTDGVMVVKNGRVVYEKYVGGYKGHPERLHCMWSASKSFTTAIAGAVAEMSERKLKGEDIPGAKLTLDGKAITLGTKLSQLMTAEQLAELASDARVGDLTMEQFLTMAPNLDWRERYEGDLTQSSIVKMLWLDGPKDMAKHAANVPFGAEGPGNKFIYSSGNALIVMRGFQATYGGDYARMPWNTLFDKVGMNKVVFEKDKKGVFVGSSYVHTTLRDMAKFGYAYLNGGYFGGEQVIHRDFVQKARELGLGMRASGTTEENITEEAGYYSLGFWINPHPTTLEKTGMKSFSPAFPRKKFLPSVPEDMFFAAGHYGQNILIFPKDDLMVVRMSHDKEYWSKLDRMSSAARNCFNKR